MAFSVVSRESFKNVQSSWLHEVRSALPNVPIILVGNKSDLRGQDPSNEVPDQEAKDLAAQPQIQSLKGFHKYLDCSAKRNLNIKSIFEEAVTAVIASKGGYCVLL